MPRSCAVLGRLAISAQVALLGNIMRTRNASQYMLVLPLCLVLTAVMRATAICLILMILRQEAKIVKWRKKDSLPTPSKKVKGKAVTAVYLEK